MKLQKADRETATDTDRDTRYMHKRMADRDGWAGASARYYISFSFSAFHLPNAKWMFGLDVLVLVRQLLISQGVGSGRDGSDGLGGRLCKRLLPPWHLPHLSIYFGLRVLRNNGFIYLH